ncbi:Major Facilitator Superfamily protein [Trichomonas vaginalis G3]|uniref:Major Facilitator Superfamily protein n=1 Tax=Trichomonas vaginalis (strain ATCC PRA-98 / G3) TaxID=412133 RepID=A2FW93_TRIV3|nr:major facilitator superfamily transporter [Trichomonas vaginalis G3]EAX90826.1 Major Facilitator Superfamily protein [Trichomonas vaginalis G3]KAI5519623.1 sucrose transmembrane transporter protein [Trichomonas vaginalis G3]|eukprot:XP_001303756.1 major facilitator superfamily transporter [Trichomonas vaginalis G3]
MIAISFALLGYQLAYACNFAMITPIMSRLNFPEHIKPIVWWAAPITDLVVQPIVAYYSDQSFAKMGRRRPYLIVGGLGTSSGFLMIYFCEKMGQAISKTNALLWSQIIFSAAFVIMNIALNILQGPARSLVGDVVPVHQQIVANTIATIMNGCGAIIVNLVGAFDIGNYIPHFNNEQFVFMVGMSLVFIAVLITIIFAPEVRYSGPKTEKGLWTEIYKSFRYAPKLVTRAAVCFGLAWCGFFEFLVEVTDFFGREVFHGNPNSSCLDDKNNYTKGVNFGMGCIAATYAISLMYGFVQPYLISKLGARTCFAASQFIEVASLIIFNFISNKYALFCLFAMLGVSFMAFNSIPFAIVAMAVPEQDMGKFMAVVNSCGCVGQQTANIVIGSGIMSLLKSINFAKPYNIQIASGGFFALLSGILTVRMIVPGEKPKGLNNTPLLEEKEN